jgi:hypothetical protein
VFTVEIGPGRRKVEPFRFIDGYLKWSAGGSGRTGKGLLAKGYRFEAEFD